MTRVLLIVGTLLASKFSNGSKIKFTVESNNGETITTLFSEKAKPLVDRYKFVKGFNEGGFAKGSAEGSVIKMKPMRMRSGGAAKRGYGKARR